MHWNIFPVEKGFGGQLVQQLQYECGASISKSREINKGQILISERNF